MKKVLFSIALLIPIFLICQDEYDFEVIASNQVRIIEGHSVSLQDSSQHRFITEERFNIKGRRTSYKVFKSNGSITEYKYYYTADTIRHTRETLFDGIVDSVTKFIYDDHARIVKLIDYNKDDTPSGTYQLIDYKRKGRWIEERTYFDNVLTVHSKTVSSKSGKPDKHYQKINNRWSEKEITSKQVKLVRQYNSTNLDLKRITENVLEDCRRMGIVGPIDLRINDQLITEQYINANELIEYEVQFLNGKLNAKKQYKYTF